MTALLFSGVDLATVGSVEDLADFWSSADLQGDLVTYPGEDGAIAPPRQVPAQSRTAELTVFGDDLADTEAAVAAAKTLLRLGEQQILTRRKTTPAGNLDTTQRAVTRSIAERWLAPTACALLVTVETLDGAWYGVPVTLAAVAGTHNVAGDLRTTAIAVTLAAGAVNPQITNSTNGYGFRWAGTVPAGGLLVDVRARTATAVTGGVNHSAALTWGKPQLLQLSPGSNTLTVSSGTASLTYRPAWA